MTDDGAWETMALVQVERVGTELAQSPDWQARPVLVRGADGTGMASALPAKGGRSPSRGLHRGVVIHYHADRRKAVRPCMLCVPRTASRLCRGRDACRGGVSAVTLWLAGCGGPQSALDPAGRGAERIADLFWWMAAGAVVIWLAVVGLAIYAMRVRPEAAQPERGRVPHHWWRRCATDGGAGCAPCIRARADAGSPEAGAGEQSADRRLRQSSGGGGSAISRQRQRRGRRTRQRDPPARRRAGGVSPGEPRCHPLLLDSLPWRQTRHDSRAREPAGPWSRPGPASSAASAPSTAGPRTP